MSLTVAAVEHLRGKFWGQSDTPAPKTSVRRKQIREILTAAYKGVHGQKDFFFKIENPSDQFGRSFQVCEKGFLAVLGLSTSKPPRMWRYFRHRVRRQGAPALAGATQTLYCIY